MQIRISAAGQKENILFDKPAAVGHNYVAVNRGEESKDRKVEDDRLAVFLFLCLKKTFVVFFKRSEAHAVTWNGGASIY